MKGISCKLNFNQDGTIQNATAPDGSVSKLYTDALNQTGDQRAALKIWAVAYSDDYLKENPWTHYPKAEEPSLDTILAYLDRKIDGSFNMSLEDRRSMVNFVRALDYDNAAMLPSLIAKHFVKNGEVVISEDTLRKSGLYTKYEISRLMSDGVALVNAQNMMEQILSLSSDEIDDMMSEVGSTADPYYELSSVSHDKFDSLGKAIVTPGNIVLKELMDKIAGKEVAEIEEALSDFEYQDIYAKYLSNTEFREKVDSLVKSDEYGNLMTAEHLSETAEPFRERGNEAQMYIFYDKRNADRASDAINDAIGVIYDNSGGRREALRTVEEECAKCGIDVIGLANEAEVHTDQETMEFLSELDVAITSGNMFSGIQEAMDGFFAQEGYSSSVYSEVENAVVIEGTTNESVGPFCQVAIGHDGFREVPLYVENNVSLDDMYDIVQDRLANGAVAVSTHDAITDVALNAKNMNSEDFRKAMKEAVDSMGKDEVTVLTQLGMGRYGRTKMKKEAINQSKINSMSARLSDLYKGESFDQMMYPKMESLTTSLYRKRLMSKFSNDESWQKFWRHVHLNPVMGFTIDGSAMIAARDILDMETLKELEQLAFENGITDRFGERFQPNFVSETDSRTDWQTRAALYLKNPSLAKEVSNINEDGSIENTYDDFINHNGVLYAKVNENKRGGIYERMSYQIVDMDFKKMSVDAYDAMASDDGYFYGDEEAATLTATNYNNTNLKEC